MHCRLVSSCIHILCCYSCTQGIWFVILIDVYFSQGKNKPWHPRVYSWIWHHREHFVFVINSPVYSPPESQDSLVYSPPWSCDSPVYLSPDSRDSPVMNTPGSWPKLVYKKSCWCKIHQEVKTTLWLIRWRVFTPWSFCHQKVSL